MELKGKIVLITGSSKGIGEEIAYAFSKEGTKVIVTYNSDEESAKKVEEKCKAHDRSSGGQAQGFARCEAAPGRVV